MVAANLHLRGNIKWAALSLVPVILWSSKPLLLEVSSAGIDFLSLLIWSSALAAGASSLILLFNKATRTRFTLLLRTFPALRDSLIAGIFLAIWYYGYYRALSEANQAVVTVIAFTWPLIAIIVTPLIDRNRGTVSRNPALWGWLLLGFCGALVVSWGNNETNTNGNVSGILWAIAAAIGSGLYLPFAVRAMSKMKNDAESDSITTTFTVMTVANAATLLTALTFAGASNHAISAPATIPAWAVCFVIGVGIYLIAEVLWSYVFARSPETSAPLPYLVPALSVLLLFLIFSVPVSFYTVCGMVLIIGANIAVNRVSRREQEHEQRELTGTNGATS